MMNGLLFNYLGLVASICLVNIGWSLGEGESLSNIKECISFVPSMLSHISC